jgi:putative transposase
MRHIARMHSDALYHRHRFPAEIISHSIWLYFRFALSFRDVEEMLAMRGVALNSVSSQVKLTMPWRTFMAS